MKTKLLFFLIVNFVICHTLLSQNITNTLGSNGTFTIKYGTTNYLSLSQTTGNVSFFRNMELGGITSSTSTSGVITKNGISYVHNYGFDNTFIGLNSGNFNFSPGSSIENVGVGDLTLSSLLSGDYNTALGFASLYSNNSGTDNTAVGRKSLLSNISGSYNTAIGESSLYYNTTGSYNVAIGRQSLFNNTTANDNTSIGFQSLYFNSTGRQNVAVGSYALTSNTTGILNTAVGHQSLYKNTSGSQNLATGTYSLYSNTIGINNTAVGYLSLFNNISGNNNTAVGYQTLNRNTGGNYNTAVGYNTLLDNTTGDYNSAFSQNSLSSNTTGHRNAAFGNFSLLTNTTGFMNSAFGYDAGTTVTTGSNLVLVGYNSQPSTGSATNQVTLGNNQISSLRCNVQVITSLSDARDKKNITDLSPGLDFISQLKPRQFNWDKREWYDENISDGSKMTETPTAGFIAQELDEAQTTAGVEWLNLVLKDNPEKWEATYGNLLPVMVKAIQELKSENDALKDKLTQFEQMHNMLAGEIEKLKSKDNGIREVNSEINSTVNH